MQKIKAWRSKAYLAYVRDFPCKHCGKPSDDAHHLTGFGLSGVGSKASDIATVSLCRPCHQAVHQFPMGYPQTKWLIETLSQALQDGVIS